MVGDGGMMMGVHGGGAHNRRSRGRPRRERPRKLRKRVMTFVVVDVFAVFIGLSVFGSRNQAKDHGLGTVQRTAYPT